MVPRIDPRYERRVRAEPYEKFVFAIHAEITINPFFALGDICMYLSKMHGQRNDRNYRTVQHRNFRRASTNINFRILILHNCYNGNTYFRN